MGFFSFSNLSRIGFWVPFVAVCVSAWATAGSLRAEGVVSGGSFVHGGLGAEVSLVNDLGGASLATVAPAATSASTPDTLINPRSASPRERIDSEVGTDLFRNLRLTLPLVMESTVGAPVDAPMTAVVRPMSGQMVGLRPHPRTWGSTLGR